MGPLGRLGPLGEGGGQLLAGGGDQQAGLAVGLGHAGLGGADALAVGGLDLGPTGLEQRGDGAVDEVLGPVDEGPGVGGGLGLAGPDAADAALEQLELGPHAADVEVHREQPGVGRHRRHRRQTRTGWARSRREGRRQRRGPREQRPRATGATGGGGGRGPHLGGHLEDRGGLGQGLGQQLGDLQLGVLATVLGPHGDLGPLTVEHGLGVGDRGAEAGDEHLGGGAVVLEDLELLLGDTDAGGQVPVDQLGAQVGVGAGPIGPGRPGGQRGRAVGGLLVEHVRGSHRPGAYEIRARKA